ncbi:MAG: DUF2314 domain-containing protein [Treponema sp.]|jgi:uncharacterized protein YegJ (DUF2314 family)|nr:DUF2314 domain-containing protein [Treponema sp.]
MMKLCLILLVLLLSSCTKPAPITDVTLHRSQSDEILQEISRQAQETFSVFLDKLHNPEPGEEDFMVKYPFEADPGSGFSHEHVWLGDIVIEHESYYGFITNTPYYIANLSLGDRVSFDISAISDWMYRKNNKIIGGRSIKYLIEQTPQPDWEPEVRKYYEQFE